MFCEIGPEFMCWFMCYVKVSAQGKFYVEENGFIYYFKKAYKLNFPNMKSIFSSRILFFCSYMLAYVFLPEIALI